MESPGRELTPEEEALFEGLKQEANQQNPEQMEALAMRLLELSARDAERFPRPGQEDEERLQQHLRNADWEGALRVLEMLQKGAEERGDSASLFRHHRQQSWILRLRGDLAAACDAAGHASQAARLRTDFEMLQVMAFENEAACRLAAGDAAAALALVKEAFRLIPAEDYAEVSRMKCQMLLASVQLELGDLQAVETALESSEAWLRRMSDGVILAGIQSIMAGWLSANGRLKELRGDLEGALAAQEESVARLRALADAQHLEWFEAAIPLSRGLQRQAELLASAGCPVEAAAVREEYLEILDRLKVRRPDPGTAG